MKKISAAGVIIFRETPEMEFLLMRHPERWDLPKGHLEAGESVIEGALREMREETGIDPDWVVLEPGFEYHTSYQVTYADNKELFEKELTLYWVWLDENADVVIQPTEHIGYQWFKWDPPHTFEVPTIDEILAQIADFLDRYSTSNDPV